MEPRHEKIGLTFHPICATVPNMKSRKPSKRSPITGRADAAKSVPDILSLQGIWEHLPKRVLKELMKKTY